MNYQLAVYRTASDGTDRLGQFIDEVDQQGALRDWTGSSRFAVGDLVFFYFTKPTAAVIAVGFVSSQPKEAKGIFDWRQSGTRTFFCDFKPVMLLGNPVLLPAVAGSNPAIEAWWATQPWRHSRVVEQPVAGRLLSDVCRLNPELSSVLSAHGCKTGSISTRHGNERLFTEGGTSEIVREVSYRDPRLKTHAIATHGYACMVCEHPLSDIYGEQGEGYIELHHLKPLSKHRGPYHPTLDDVILVCPNCHRILHRDGDDPLPWKDLRRSLRSRRRLIAQGHNRTHQRE